jgi:hypothetical protein
MLRPKKAKKAGRPPLPKGEAKVGTLRIRVTPDELHAIEATAKDEEQTVSDWIRRTLLRSWWLTCKSEDCRKPFKYRDIDELHPRETTNNPDDDPCKPNLNPGGQKISCPHCNQNAMYRRWDLRLNSN